MCELVYLDQFREAVADAKIAEEFAAAINEGRAEAEAINKKIDAAEDAMNQLSSGANLDLLSERIAKVMLDTAFVKIDQATSLEARQRLLRYAVELCRKLKNDLDIELDWAAVIKEKLDGREVD